MIACETHSANIWWEYTEQRWQYSRIMNLGRSTQTCDINKGRSIQSCDTNIGGT